MINNCAFSFYILKGNLLRVKVSDLTKLNYVRNLLLNYQTNTVLSLLINVIMSPGRVTFKLNLPYGVNMRIG